MAGGFPPVVARPVRRLSGGSADARDPLPHRGRDRGLGGSRGGCLGGGRLVAARWPADLRVSVEPDVFLHYKNLWPGGTPPDPRDRFGGSVRRGWLPTRIGREQHTPLGPHSVRPLRRLAGGAPPLTPGRATARRERRTPVWVRVRASEAERAEWHAKARSAGPDAVGSGAPIGWPGVIEGEPAGCLGRLTVQSVRMR